MTDELHLRVTVVNPPSGVDVALQLDENDLVRLTCTTKESISFDISVRVAAEGHESMTRLLGRGVHGPPSARFLYVNWGVRAGQASSCWDRRAKVPLSGITPSLIAACRANPKARLEVRFEGTGRDGGPACATVPILPPGWFVTSEVE